MHFIIPLPMLSMFNFLHQFWNLRCAQDSSQLRAPGWDAVTSAMQAVKEGKKVSRASGSDAKPTPPSQDAATAAAASEASSVSARQWSRDELSTLAKAVSKFPAGLGSRWLTVCNHMNEILKPTVPYTEQVNNSSKIYAKIRMFSCTRYYFLTASL